MTKISQLPQDSTPTNTDYIVVVDSETGSTKKVLLTNLLATQELIGTDGIVDDAVTPDKLSPLYTASLLASTQVISSATMADTNLTLTLPTIGTWVIVANLRWSASNANDWAESRIYNSTDGVDADSVNSESDFLSFLTPGGAAQGSSSKTVVCVTTATNTVITLQAKRGTANNISLASDTNGKSSLTAFRIG